MTDRHTTNRLVRVRAEAIRLFVKDVYASDMELLRMALAARERAQAPYSNYLVGAAVRSADSGDVYLGCNVERVSFTQTTHAEQNAVDSMVTAEGAGAKIAAIAIVGAARDVILPPLGSVRKNDPVPPDWTPTAPCGHCLQCIWENCRGDRKVRLLSYLPDGLVCITTIGHAFPFAFGPEALDIKL